MLAARERERKATSSLAKTIAKQQTTWADRADDKAREKVEKVVSKVAPLLAPDALAHAAAPQLAWLRATIQAWQTRHEERRQAMLAEQRQRREQRGGDSGATPAASVPPARSIMKASPTSSAFMPRHK